MSYVLLNNRLFIFIIDFLFVVLHQIWVWSALLCLPLTYSLHIVSSDRVKIEYCLICGSRQLDREFSCTDHYATGEEFTVCSCRECGFRFTQDFPNEEVIGRYYLSDDYISHTDSKEGLMNKIYHTVRSYMLRSKRHLVHKHSNDGGRRRILDVGAGTGYFVHEMLRKGWDARGVEKSADARNVAKKNFDITLHEYSWFETREDKSFDIITMWHVLEHIEPLVYTVRNVHRLLSDGGMFILALPNHRSYDAQHYKENWAAYDVPRHLWHFSADNIKKLLEQNGFELVEKKTMPFDGFYVSVLTEKNIGGGSAIKGMWVGFLSWVHSIFNKDKSSSLIYVFRKK